MLVVADKEAKKRCKDMWTKEMLEAHGENLQRLVKERYSNHKNNPIFLQPWQVKMN